MKKIAILSPETVPLTLLSNAPSSIQENNKTFDIKNKCTRVTATGKRSWKIAEFLSKEKDFEVTLLIPDINFPKHEYIDNTNINFKLKSYNYKAATWEWSEELDEILLNFDFAIIQTTAGVGFSNFSILPRSVNVIVDGWIPMLPEFSCSLTLSKRIFRKIMWKKFMGQYSDLIRRSNCVLYGNERQYYYYEGQFYMIDKLDWSSYKFSPLLKVPYGIDINPLREKLYNGTNLKLLWYGATYPWYNPEQLIDVLESNKNISIDFVGLKHPRFNKISNSNFKKYYDKLETCGNATIIEEYNDNPAELFKHYDAGVLLANEWLEEKYSHRCRVMEMISHGLPVIMNSYNALYQENDFLRTAIYPINTYSIKEDIDDLCQNKKDIFINEDILKDIQSKLSWDVVLKPLAEYIHRF